MCCEYCESEKMNIVSGILTNFECGSYTGLEGKLRYRTQECKDKELKRKFGDIKAIKLATTHKCSICNGSGYTSQYHTVDNVCYRCGGQGSVIGSKISLEELKFLLERL